MSSSHTWEMPSGLFADLTIKSFTTPDCDGKNGVKRKAVLNIAARPERFHNQLPARFSLFQQCGSAGMITAIRGEAMYQKIIVPLDGSTLSAGILPYVRWLTTALGLPLELLHVHDADALKPYGAPGAGLDYLEKVAAAFPQSLRVRCSVAQGNPAAVIIERASNEIETLIAMATHGYSGAARWLLGSVAQKVLHALPSDLLLSRPASDNGQVRMRTILAPLDRSLLAEQALPRVVELSDRLDLEVLLVHVTKHVYSGPPDAFLPVFGAIPNLKELWERDKAAGNQYLAEKVEQLRAKGAGRLSSRVLEGGVDGAAGEVVELARTVPDCLIAMTSRGEGGIGQWLVGSVTERVVCNSRSPVLVVRSQS